MAKKKPAPTTHGAKEPVSLRLSPAMLAALDKYRAQFPFKPDRSAVLQKALREFLVREKIDVPKDDDD